MFRSKWLYAVAVASLTVATAANGQTRPLCDSTYHHAVCVTDASIGANCGTNGPYVYALYENSCATGQPFAREKFYCMGATCPSDPIFGPHDYDTENCKKGIAPAEKCDNTLDDNYDGCINEGCTVGTGQCTCAAKCDSFSCDKPKQATCDPFNGQAEVCFDGKDNNCNGQVDEGCSPCKGDGCCQNKAGTDPILLSTQSAVTEPFTDFQVDTGVGRLGITRTYSSADWSYFGGPAGIFGRGWHHDWEGWLSCADGRCTVTHGTDRPLQFKPSGTAISNDGTETWQIYGAWSDQVIADDVQTVLVRRPTGEWIAFLPSGEELHYATVCDACGSASSDSYCQDPLSGGKARLTTVVDAHGQAVQVSYNRPSGVLLSLGDSLGHLLQVRDSTACGPGLAAALVYDGFSVALRRTRFSWTRCSSVQGDHDEERETDGERGGG